MAALAAVESGLAVVSAVLRVELLVGSVVAVLVSAEVPEDLSQVLAMGIVVVALALPAGWVEIAAEPAKEVDWLPADYRIVLPEGLRRSEQV